MPGVDDLDFDELVDVSEGFSGKDIMTVVSLCVRESIMEGIVVLVIVKFSNLFF